MGGNAIPGVGRIPKTVYRDLIVHVKQSLKTLRIRETYTLSAKESHGDIDFIVVPDSGYSVEALHPRQIRHSGRHSVSAGVQYGDGYYQLDFQTATLESFDHLHAFYSYSIFGICMSLGLKHASPNLVYGVSGLEYRTTVLSYGKHDVVKLLLSESNTDILGFLGLDVDQFERGFANNEEVFRYVLQCPYIDPETFEKGARKNTLHERLRFLEQFDFESVRRAQQIIPDAVKHFRKDDQYAKLLHELEQRRQLAERFNGRIVHELTGLSGQPLGKFIRDIKAKHELMSMSREAIREIIVEEFKTSQM